MKRLKWAAILAAMAGLFAPSVSAQEMMYGDTQTKIRHTEWSKNAVVYEANLRQGTKGRTSSPSAKNCHDSKNSASTSFG
jgi:hypothetical protein